MDVKAEIPATATPQANIEVLVATLKAFRTEIQMVKTQMEQQITDLQAKLYPKTRRRYGPNEMCWLL